MSMSRPSYPSLRLLMLILLIVPLIGMGLDLYVPSLPAMAQYFGVNKSWVQLTLTTYLLGHGLCQPIYGTLSDTVGRRPLLLFGLFLFALVSFLIPFTSNIWILLALRFLQGCGASAIAVLTKSIAVDSFSDAGLSKTVNYMTITWALGMIIAPVIGGYLQHYCGWKAAFYSLTGYTLVAFLIMYFALPETIRTRHTWHMPAIVSKYKTLLSHSRFLSFAFTLACMRSLLALFGVMTPFIVQNQLHYSAIEFGHYALFVGLAWFAGNVANRLFKNVLDDKPIIPISLMVLLVASLLFVLISCFYFTVAALLAGVIPILFFTALLYPRYATMAMSLFPEFAGTAVALRGSILVSFTCIISAIASTLIVHSLLPLAGAYALLILLVNLFYFAKLRCGQKELVLVPGSQQVNVAQKDPP